MGCLKTLIALNRIGLISSDNFVIFKFRNSKLYLKANIGNNIKTQILKFLNSYALKWYEARLKKKMILGSNFAPSVQNLTP